MNAALDPYAYTGCGEYSHFRPVVTIKYRFEYVITVKKSQIFHNFYGKAFFTQF